MHNLGLHVRGSFENGIKLERYWTLRTERLTLGACNNKCKDSHRTIRALCLPWSHVRPRYRIFLSLHYVPRRIHTNTAVHTCKWHIRKHRASIIPFLTGCPLHSDGHFDTTAPGSFMKSPLFMTHRTVILAQLEDWWHDDQHVGTCVHEDQSHEDQSGG